MKFLIYYKIETDHRTFEEDNFLIESKGPKLTYEELFQVFAASKDKYNTYHNPIIINIMELN